MMADCFWPKAPCSTISICHSLLSVAFKHNKSLLHWLSQILRLLTSRSAQLAEQIRGTRLQIQLQSGNMPPVDSLPGLPTDYTSKVSGLLMTKLG